MKSTGLLTLLCLWAGVPSIANALQAFTSTDELYAAVDDYLGNLTYANSTDSALKYGYPMGSWDVSQITNFTRVFDSYRTGTLTKETCKKVANPFNQDISAWQVGNAVTMEGMFACCNRFNRDISQWNTANVASMKGIFLFATEFNQNVGNWDVSKVVDFSYAFAGASNFVSDLSTWTVSAATDMSFMVSSFTFHDEI